MYASFWAAFRPSSFHIYGNHSCPASLLPRLLESCPCSAEAHTAIWGCSCLNPSKASHHSLHKLLASVLAPMRPHLDHPHVPPVLPAPPPPPIQSQQPCWWLPLASSRSFSLSLDFSRAGGFQVFQTFQPIPLQDLGHMLPSLLQLGVWPIHMYLSGLSLIAVSSEKSFLILHYSKTRSPTPLFSLYRTYHSL